jgi:hypothetical protein
VVDTATAIPTTRLDRRGQATGPTSGREPVGIGAPDGGVVVVRVPTGMFEIGDHLSRWWTAGRSRPGDRVLDTSGATLSFLVRQRPDLHSLTVLGDGPGTAHSAAPFPVTYRRRDISRPWPVAGPFDLVVHTDPPVTGSGAMWKAGVEQAAAVLTIGGQIVLSVPVEVEDPSAVLRAAHLTIEEIRGVEPPSDPATVETILAARFGTGAVALHRSLRQGCPDEYVDPLIASALAGDAERVLYACRKRRRPSAPDGTSRS